VLLEIEQWLKQGGTADYITFAGSGEPTLNADLGEMIVETKKLTDIPLAVITNGSLLGEPEIREAVSMADVLMPSLDAGTEQTFHAVNRPARGVSFIDMTEGLVRAAQEFAGEIWLEIMLVDGINDSEAELLALRRTVRRICPDKLQISTVERPSKSGDAKRVPEETLIRAREILGGAGELVTGSQFAPGDSRQWQQVEEELIKMLSIRPCTIDDIVAASGRNFHEVSKHLSRMIQKGMLEKVGEKDPYYRCTVRGGGD
jgi:wyosine [tRNA(Phe)-imidazoG37] synthetase (radical SAM superfamily)